MYNVRGVSLNVKKLCERVVVSTVTCYAEVQGIRMEERHKLNIMFECLRSMCGVTRMERWRKEKMRRLVAVREKNSEMKGLKLFGHVERIIGERLTRGVYDLEAQG